MWEYIALSLLASVAALCDGAPVGRPELDGETNPAIAAIAASLVLVVAILIMGWTEKRLMTDARRRNSHVPLNTRRQRLRDRWSLITLLVALNLIPPHTAANGLGSYLIRNPHRRSGTVQAFIPL
jgi:hypothetical protein